MHILSTQSPCVHTLSRNLVKSSKWICAGSFDLVQYWLSGDLFDLNWAYWPKWTISTFLLRQGRITMSKLYCQTLFRKNLRCFDALYCVLLQYVLLYCNLCNFVAIYAVLSRFTRFCVEKSWTKNCACGEKKTNIRYVLRGALVICKCISMLWLIQEEAERFVLGFRAKPGRTNSRLTRVLTLVLYPKSKKYFANIKAGGAHLWCSAETRTQKDRFTLESIQNLRERKS